VSEIGRSEAGTRALLGHEPVYRLFGHDPFKGAQFFAVSGLVGVVGGACPPSGKTTVNRLMVPCGRFSTSISRITLRSVETGVPATVKL
jgi:hypothetical protein